MKVQRIVANVGAADPALAEKFYGEILGLDLLMDMDLQCRRFEFCPEVTAKAIRMGERIKEVPIQYEPRSKAAGKKIRWTDAPEAFWTLLRYRFWNRSAKRPQP